MSEQNVTSSNRWTTRDVLTFVVFNLIIIVITMAAKMIEDMLLTPQNEFFVGSWLFPLLVTPFYLVMATASQNGACSRRPPWCSA